MTGHFNLIFGDVIIAAQVTAKCFFIHGEPEDFVGNHMRSHLYRRTGNLLHMPSEVFLAVEAEKAPDALELNVAL